MDKKTAYTMTRLMMGVVQSGTAWRVKKYLPDVEVAGKTGTTNDYTDAWFVGFTPELVAGCWVGFDDQRISFGSYGQGGTAAAPIYGRLMAKIYNDVTLPYTKKEFDLPKPDSMRVPEVEMIMGTDSNLRLRPDSGMRNVFPPLPKEPDGSN